MKPRIHKLLLLLFLLLLTLDAKAGINGPCLQNAPSQEAASETIDSRARSDDSTRSRGVIIHREQSLHSFLNQATARLIRAYESEDPQGFMELVSDDYTGGKLNLDSAVRRDFTLLDNIEIQASLTNFAVDPDGYAHISLTYSRYVTSARSGSSLQDNGLTEMVFKMEDNHFRLYSMKNPLIFGLSDAPNVASGKVNAGVNDEILVIQESGEAKVLPFNNTTE
ncbi:MAG: hypothetical protein ACOC7W_04385 [Desulfosalsimonas sp.]